jgi:hypothetical protein
MTDQQNDNLTLLHNILNAADDVTGGTIIYANNVRFHIGLHEVTIDLYLLNPSSTGQEPSARAKHVSRFMLPIGVAKEVAQLLSNNISDWEIALGRNISLVPSEEPDTSD